MRQFDRITADYQKLGGLPHFRDTSITVSEIVRMVMTGKPNSEILAQYPDLEPEDIQEALVYSLKSQVNHIGFTRFEVIGKFSSVILSLDFLMDSDLEADDRQTFAQLSQENVQSAIKLVYNLQDWSGYSCLGAINYLTTIDMTDILNELIEYHHSSVTSLDITTPTKFSEVQADRFQMFTALKSLTTGNWIIDCKEHSQMEVKEADDRLIFSIQRTFLEPLKDFASFVEQLKTIATYPNDLAIAALIIHQHGSELQIKPDDKGVTFTFELPVSQEDKI